MKTQSINFRVSDFDRQKLDYICEKYKCSQADAMKKALDLLISWDLGKCNKNLDKHGVTRPVNYEKGIE